MRTEHPSQQLAFLLIEDDSRSSKLVHNNAKRTRLISDNQKRNTDKPWKLSNKDKIVGLAGIEAVRSALAKSDPSPGEILAKAS